MGIKPAEDTTLEPKQGKAQGAEGQLYAANDANGAAVFIPGTLHKSSTWLYGASESSPEVR